MKRGSWNRNELPAPPVNAQLSTKNIGREEFAICRRSYPFSSAIDSERQSLNGPQFVQVLPLRNRGFSARTVALTVRPRLVFADTAPSPRRPLGDKGFYRRPATLFSAEHVSAMQSLREHVISEGSDYYAAS